MPSFADLAITIRCGEIKKNAETLPIKRRSVSAFTSWPSSFASSHVFDVMQANLFVQISRD
jgi:hypothetical protein